MQLLSEWIKSLGDISFLSNLTASRIALAVLLLAVCIVMKRILNLSFAKILKRTRIEKGLHTFLKSTVNILLWFVVVFIVADALGIDSKLLIAAVSVVGLALSLAVQASLSNLAGGINILASKVFVVGDYVEVGNDGGIVHDIGLVHTSLTTLDNRRILVPNSKVMSARVINYSTEPKRRVDLDFSTSYDAPIQQVKSVLEQMIADHPKALVDPAPMVRVMGYEDNKVQYIARVWCMNDDYWDLYHDLLENMKTKFEENGIKAPCPYMNVHILENKP
jgi:small conductance mechanosensitive channel